MKKITILFLALVTISSVFAQQKRRKRPQMEYINSIQLTAGTGTSTYYGDLCDNIDCMVFRPQANIGLLYRSSSRLLLRNEFHFIRLYGTDKGGPNEIRNLHFRSTNLEILFSGLYDLIPYERKFRYRTPITPFVFAGAGITFFQPRAELNGKWVNLRPLKTEGKRYNIITPVISYGAGIRYKVSPELNLSTEIGYRWTFTDYLDDVSTNYVNNQSFDNSTAATLADRTDESGIVTNNKNFDQTSLTWDEGHIRGNPKRKDGYVLFGVKLEYRIKYTAQTGGFRRIRRK